MDLEGHASLVTASERVPKNFDSLIAVGVVYELGVILIVFYWFHFWLFHEAPEVLGFVAVPILGDVPLLWLKVMAHRVLSSKSSATCVGISLSVQILAY